MKQQELEDAVFWDRHICVECEAVFDLEDAGDEKLCPNCGSSAIAPGASVLRLLQNLEPGGSSEDGN